VKFELIQWLDHISITDGWFRGEAIDKLKPGSVIQSVGWVYKEDKDCVHLVATMSQNGQYSGHTCILKKLIQNRWKLRDPGRKTRQQMAG
jgi:hypothetical protein